MLDRIEATDGDLARAVAAQVPGVAEAAEAELYRRLAPRVRLYGLRHLRDEEAARDLVQEVLLLTIEKLREGAVREPDRVASFVLGTSRLLAENRRRTERRREHLRAAHMIVEVVDPQDEPSGLDLDRVEACVERLGDRERLVVVLTFYAEQPSETIARTLGTTTGNIRVIRHRALDRLRDCVKRREAVS
jgi:RNA polymerase sigma-70 factor (ECF subfamily)